MRRKCYAPLPYCNAVSRRDEIKTIKPIINEAFIASSGEIITDYNDLYWLFTCHVASHRVNITMSAFVIKETTSTALHCSKLAFESSVTNYLNKKTYLQAVSQKRNRRLVGIASLYRNSLCASQRCRLLFQVQEIVLRKMCCTHSNIWVELFWNSVVIQLNHWFLVESSFGSPNKVLSLSHWNTASPGHGAGGSNNTTVRIKSWPLSLRVCLGSVLQIFPHRDVDMWGVFESAVLGGVAES